MDQLSFFDAERSVLREYDDVDAMLEKVREGETDDDLFSYNDTKFGRSYSVYGTKVFEFQPAKTSNDSGKLKVSSDLLALFDKKEQSGERTDFVALAVNTLEEQERLITALKEEKRYLFRNLITDTFACCNDFRRCSEAGTCIHQDDRFYNGCAYRLNLEQGKIFYGSKRTIKVSEEQIRMIEEYKTGCSQLSRYVCFDVETPNAKNDAVSAIGIVILEGDRVVQKYYSLVNPEQCFDSFNVNLTGISEETVKDAPTFPVLWETIRPLMSSGLLVAHNAPFDVSVLKKCLARYDIEWMPEFEYVCTCNLARKCFPDLENHKLRTLCDEFDISLDHHNAMSDTEACAEILRKCLLEGIDPSEHTYRSIDRNQFNASHHRSKATDQLRKLRNTVASITCDGIITESEVYALQEWLNENKELQGEYPYDRIYKEITNILEDGVIEEKEKTELLDLAKVLFDPIDEICSDEPIDLNGKNFCMTGKFAFGSDTEVQQALEQKGGIFVPSVTKKTDVLIVGKLGSPQWACGNYGNKIKKAIEMQEKGGHVVIVKEENVL